MWNVLSGTIIDKICSRVRDMKYLILVNARLYYWKKNKMRLGKATEGACGINILDHHMVHSIVK